MEELPLNITPHEDISACHSALTAISDYDEYLLSEEEKELIREIRQMSLFIIHIGIKEIYTANFYGESSQGDTSETG